MSSLLGAVLLHAATTFAAGPSISHVQPAAVAPGKATELVIFGENLSGVTTLWTSLPATVRFPRTNEPGKILCTFTPGAGVADPAGVKPLPWPVPSIGALRLATTNGLSSLHFLMIDDLLAVTESGTNTTPAAAQVLQPPIAVDGACGEQTFDYFRFPARKGQRVSIEVVAQRLGSALDPVLRVLDARGRELAYCDDDPGAGSDARLSFRAPAAGNYLIELRDVGYQGGAKFRYRLRVGDFPLAGIPFLPVDPPSCLPPSARPALLREVEPNDATNRAVRISIPATVAGTFGGPRDRDFYEFTAAKDQRLVFTGKTRSLGSPCDAALRIFKTDGTQVAATKNSDADEGAITHKFGEAGTYRLRVEELSGQHGPGLEYRIEIAPFTPGFTLSVETEKVDAASGGTFGVKVTSARRDYDGPITLSLAGLGGDFTVEDHVIPEKKNETTLKAKLPARFQPGQMFHFHIVGKAKVGGAEASATASTKPALRKLFPQMPHPPPELEGWIALGIRPPAD